MTGSAGEQGLIALARDNNPACSTLLPFCSFRSLPAPLRIVAALEACTTACTLLLYGSCSLFLCLPQSAQHTRLALLRPGKNARLV
jgi:hypothetical protein